VCVRVCVCVRVRACGRACVCIYVFVRFNGRILAKERCLQSEITDSKDWN